VNEKKLVGLFGTATECTRDAVVAAAEAVRDYSDCRLCVCEKTGIVYVSLPGTYIMTGFSSSESYGAIGLANLAAYYVDVYGFGHLSRWSAWLDCSASGTMGGKVWGLGEKFAGLHSVVWVEGLGDTEKIICLHSGFGGSEFLVRVDCFSAVEESIGAQCEYASLSDEWCSAAEYEYIWDYISTSVVEIGLALGVAIDDIAAFDSGMCSVLHDLDVAYNFKVNPDLTVDDARSLNRGAWRVAIELGAAAWVRGGCSRADVVSAAEWAGAADGDGRRLGSSAVEVRAWGAAGALDDTPAWFTGDDALSALLGDDLGDE